MNKTETLNHSTIAATLGVPGASAIEGAVSKQQTIAEAAASVATSLNYKDCYTKWKPRWLLIPADDAMRVTVDVSYVMQCIYGILPEIEKIRDQLYQECPALSPTLIEDVREATGGLGHCEMLKRSGPGVATDNVENPVDVVRGIRGQLVFHGGPLIAQGKLTEGDLTLSQGNSPRDIAFDVMKFVAKIGDNFQYLEGKSMLTRADLDSATKAAEDLLEFLGVKGKAAASSEEATLMRQRALTQVYELYEELRAGVRFARRKQKDGGVITPSIFTMRNKKTGRDGEEDSATEEGQTPATGTTTTDSDSASSTGIDLLQLQALMASGGAPTNAQASAAPNSVTTNSDPTAKVEPAR